MYPHISDAVAVVAVAIAVAVAAAVAVAVAVAVAPLEKIFYNPEPESDVLMF